MKQENLPFVENECAQNGHKWVITGIKVNNPSSYNVKMICHCGEEKTERITYKNAIYNIEYRTETA